MKAVIDSSTLISFAKIGATELLEKVGGTLVTPLDAYTECVEKGLESGRIDAVIIKRLFDKGTITKIKVAKPVKITGLSETDSQIIALAQQEKADYVFANDKKLGRRTEASGFEVRGSPDILLRMLLKKEINRREYTNYIKSLAENKRISHKNMIEYLKEE